MIVANPVREHTAIGPELFHYPKYYMALLWGCCHDRAELAHVETGAPARWDCHAGIYECGNGHLYERRDDGSWAVYAADEVWEAAS